MGAALSLRARLTAIILGPLVVIAAAIGLWAVLDAQTRADDRFNRALLSTALAVSRDVAISGGDAISPETSTLLRDTSGGPVFYHVYAPDGVFVTGYATPPVPVSDTPIDAQSPQFYSGVHQSRPVRAIRFVDAMQVEGLSGNYTVTVWQDRAHRNALVRELVQGTILVISLLVASVALVVWFGVRFGLRPLNDLEAAIARRSSNELSTIQRDVPREVTGIVLTLNGLFEQLARSMAAQNDFISNAAHQLRNPIAGVLSLAEAVQKAPSRDEAKRRSQDLLEAARDASDLSQKLLLLERAKAISPASTKEEFDLSAAVSAWIDGFQQEAPHAVSVNRDVEDGLRIRGDPTMLREALRNLFDNAIRHGGPGLSDIKVTCARVPRGVVISVEDNGRGIDASDLSKAKERFKQLSPTSSSGLGVSIVDTIAASHDGHLSLTAASPGLRAEIFLTTEPPVADPANEIPETVRSSPNAA